VLLERLYDDDLAQASYLIGCHDSGEMLVVDPLREPDRYLRAARRHGMRIVAVSETHIHADYLSGSLELANSAHARLYLSGEESGDWRYRFGGGPDRPGTQHEAAERPAGRRLIDGDELRLGNVVVKALHTPGHTPEHLSFLLTDGAAADEPGYLLTGDFVFVGDVGRPDLLDEAAGAVDTRFEAASRLFESLHERFLTLPDYLQVLPGHGAGSACGKALSAIPSTTVGYERRFSWWAPFLAERDEQGFVEAVLKGQPEAPSYFSRMKRLNRDGPPLLAEQRRPLEQVTAEELAGRLPADVLLIDTRSDREYIADGLAGALHVPAGARFTTYASFALDPEADRREVYLLVADARQAEELRSKLALVGVDDVRGYLTDAGGLERRGMATITPSELAELDDVYLLDVRSRGEFESGHIPGARQLHLGRLRSHLNEIPRDRPVVVHCQGGGRAAVAAGILLAEGFGNVIDLEGSYGAWRSEQDRRGDSAAR
jgi:hydroxyacylglutathione hydrolase